MTLTPEQREALDRAIAKFQNECTDPSCFVCEANTRIRATLTALRDRLDAAEPVAWLEGEPPFPQNQEWFIAETTISAERVVLQALENEHAYDYTTADGTYFKRHRIAKWMQFPDSEYKPVVQPPAPAQHVSAKAESSVPERLEPLHYAILDGVPFAAAPRREQGGE